MAKAKVKAEQFEFKTEVKQLLDLVIHSLYSHKDIFLRELISNASDAIDRLRFEALTNADLLEGDTDNKIKIVRDEKAKTITISDSGIGMSHDELSENLGTIAKSGTKAFLEQLQKNKQDVNLIGQFGVGFYSAFMVAETVSVVTKKAGSTEAWKWTSTGEGLFTIEPAEKATRGSEVILHLKEDALDYLKEWSLKEIVKKYSDFVAHPICMDVEKTEYPEGDDKDKKPTTKIVEETLNSQKAIWARPKSEIKEEEYKEFYKHLTHDYSDPLQWIHYSAEGNIEFKALLYIPGKAPFDLYYPESVKGIQLYVKRVFIMEDCKKLIPEYLRFVKGVVDSNDLPLNVSRELLQQDSQLEKIKNNLTGKILSTLKTTMEKDLPSYLKLYKEFGKVLKEGVHYDYDNKDKIVDLLLFGTTKTLGDELRTLEQYVSNMKDDQKEIYYLSAENMDVAKASPLLEMFRKKDIEVLFMTDPIDEWILNSVTEYKKKKLKAISKGDIDLDDAKTKETLQEKKKEHEGLLTFIQKQLDKDIKEVRFSSRLTDSASCLVSDENSVNKQMEQMFKAMGQPVPDQKKILELNPDHELVSVLEARFAKSPASTELKDYIELVYDQAVIAEGSTLKDPVGFIKRVSELMVKAGKTPL